MKKPITIGVIIALVGFGIFSLAPVFGENYEVIDLIEVPNGINGITSSSEIAVGSTIDGLYLFDKSMEVVNIIQIPDSLPEAKFYDPKLFNDKLLVTAHLDKYGGCNYVRIILLYDINSGNLIHQFTPLNPDSNPSCPETYGHGYSISNDKVLVTQRNISTTQYLKGEIFVYSPSSGNLLYSLHSPTPEYTPEMSSGDINSIEEYHEGFGSRGEISEKYLVISEEKKTIKRERSAGDVYVFNSDNGKLLRTITLEDTKNGYVRDLLISGDFLFLGSIDTVFQYDLRNGNVIQTFENPRENTYNFGNTIATNNGRLIVGDWVGEPRSGQVYLYDISSGKLIQEFQNPFEDRVVIKGGQKWGDGFGKTVSFLNDDILVHSPHYSDRGGSVFHISSENDEPETQTQIVPPSLQLDAGPADTPIQEIPEWVRNIFIWYAEDKVSEPELLNAIKYLVQQNVIILD